jgi:hypothetical protein
MSQELAVAKAALVDLMLAASTFADGHGRCSARAKLRQSITTGRAALKALDRVGIAADGKSLRQLAAEADTEAKHQPGYRADLEG